MRNVWDVVVRVAWRVDWVGDDDDDGEEEAVVDGLGSKVDIFLFDQVFL